MLKSMTGYGRSQQTIGSHDIMVEIRSVNHRYFEFNARVPRAFGYVEEKIKSLIAAETSRGKVDVAVSIYTIDGKDVVVNINFELAKGYTDALKNLGKELNITDNLDLATISRFQDIFLVTKTTEDEDVIWEDVSVVAKAALDQFVQMRVIEGEKMLADIDYRLGLLAGYVQKIEELSPKTVADYKARLIAKIQEVVTNPQLEESRIITEVAYFAEKIAVDEETIRLKSHLSQFKKLVKTNDSVGRKLDFLVQEINREVNTIGSKCQDLEVTSIVVDMKSELEKIREQIQNIE